MVDVSVLKNTCCFFVTTTFVLTAGAAELEAEVELEAHRGLSSAMVFARPCALTKLTASNSKDKTDFILSALGISSLLRRHETWNAYFELSLRHWANLGQSESKATSDSQSFLMQCLDLLLANQLSNHRKINA